MLGPAGLGFGPSIVCFVHGGNGGPCGKVRFQTTCICRRQPLHVHYDLSNVIVSEDPGTVHHGDQPVDVSQPAETQRRQNGTDVGHHQIHCRQSPTWPRPESDDWNRHCGGCRRIAYSDVLFTLDLAHEKHATPVSAKCFYQLRRVQRSLDRDSATTLVHAFVTSRIDYGNSLFANAPKTWTDKLHRVMNAAMRVISGTRKFDRGLTRLLHEDLHWVDIPQRITFKLCLLVFKCLHGFAPLYLAELCVPFADVMVRHNLRSATWGLLNFPRYNMISYGRSAFSYAGPHVWNSLPEHLRQTNQTFQVLSNFGQIARSAH